MLTSKRLPHHAVYAKVILVKLPQFHKLVDYCLRGAAAGRLWHKSWIGCHSEEIEIGCESIKQPEEHIGEEVRSYRPLVN